MAYLASASCFVSTFYLSLKVTQVLRWFYMAWRSKHLDQGISNFLFQTSFDSTLEFQDLVYTFSCWMVCNSQSENFLFKTRFDVIESFEDSNMCDSC